MKRNDSPSGRLDARTTVTLICLALLGLPHLLQAQAIQPSRGFEHITVDAGLVDNYLRDILQDSRGFLWIASSNGLSRYDGYGFTNFSWAAFGSFMKTRREEFGRARTAAA